MAGLFEPPETYSGRRPIFFLHVPKTAGTSVRHFLEAPLRRDEIHRVVSTANEIQRRRHERFTPNVKFVSGHVPYWFGDAIPDRQTLLFLRNPVERVLSTYYFWRSQPAPAPEDTSEDAQLLRAIADTSVEDFVFNKAAIWQGAITNYACRMVGHAQPWILDLPYNDETLKLALERLAAMDMLGVVERTNESLALIARHLGLPFEGALPSQNVTRDRPKAADISHDVIAAIQDANEGDVLLWERANAELDRRVATRRRYSFGQPRLAAIEGKFAPCDMGEDLVLKPAEHPILGSGWLAPWSNDAGSWRFTAVRGPSTLYVELPKAAALGMEIACPFAAADFDFSKLRITLDGAPLDYELVSLSTGAVIFTSPFRTGRWKRMSCIAFHYPEPQNSKADGAFAVSTITWRPAPRTMPVMSWANVKALSDRLANDIQTMSAKRAEAAEYAASLEVALADRDGHVDALSKAIDEKDLYAAALRAALADKDSYAATLLAAIEEKDCYLSSLSGVMSEKDAYAVSLLNSIAEKDAYAASLARQIEHKEREIAALRDRLEHRDVRGTPPSAAA